MGEMHEMYGAWDSGEYNPCDGDDDDERWMTCVNCGREFTSLHATLFCGDLCRDEASLVRYVRRCQSDGRLGDPEVCDAIEIRMAHVLAGGYDRRSRAVSAEVRADVIARASGRCHDCGGSGTEVDHIADSSSDPDNLQLLCRRCHMMKSLANLRVVAPGDEDYAAVNTRGLALKKRFDSPKPIRECDDPEGWPATCRGLLRERRAQLRKVD